MTVWVRPAEPNDLDGLLLLLPQLSSRPGSDATQMPPVEQARTIFQELLKRDGVTMLVAVADRSEVVVGALTLVMVPNLTYGGRPWAIVENVVVEESYRRTGVGRRLVQQAIELAEREGCYKVQLLSGGRSDQLEFYARLEFDSAECMGHKRYINGVPSPRSSSDGAA
jgi:GNAT superfamily N-acetyltransferase